MANGCLCEVIEAGVMNVRRGTNKRKVFALERSRQVVNGTLSFYIRSCA